MCIFIYIYTHLCIVPYTRVKLLRVLVPVNEREHDLIMVIKSSFAWQVELINSRFD